MKLLAALACTALASIADAAAFSTLDVERELAFARQHPGASLSASTGTVTAATNSSDGPLRPSQDPWYAPPKGWRMAQPGTILRLRDAPANLSGLVANSADAYQILYATTDSRFQPSWAVTTVFKPSKPAAAPALVAYGVPYDSAAVDASPSYTLYTSPPEELTLALARGWWISVADYETKKASFTSGPVSGMATLDAVRATLSANFSLDAAKTRLALWGYSGGALASEWAAEFAPRYTPKLNISGAALGGLTPNVTSVLFSVSGTLYAGLAPAGVLGIASQHPDLEKYVQANLKKEGPLNATGFNLARTYSLYQAIAAYAGQRIEDYFVNGSATLTQPIAIRYSNRDGQMGFNGLPDTPLFVYKAVKDQISAVGDTDDLVDRYCASGVRIRYDRNTVGGHQAEGINGLPRALDFLSSVLNGTAQPFGCQIRDVAVNITDAAF